MADTLRPILDAYFAGGMPPNIALMRLCMEAASPEEVRAAVHRAATEVASNEMSAEPVALLTPNPESERLAVLSGLLDEHGSAWAMIRAVMREAEHDRTAGPMDEAVAHWSAVFDRLAALQPEAGVALYALGSPELLGRATAEIVEALRGWKLVAPTTEVLEIGCGIGRFVAALAPEVARVTGLDVSPGMIERARERCGGFENVTLEVSSGRDIAGLADASVDLVLAADVFPYLVQAGGDLAARHVAEAARVLKPGGTLAILNYSYRGDLEADRREIAGSASEFGLAVEEPRPIFRYWDGAVYLLRKAS
jgi:predicted TPR repeat methyltransferase